MQVLLLVLLLLLPLTTQAEYLGNLSANEFDANSTANPFCAGSPFSSNSVTNEIGNYGGPFSNQSATTPYATEAPRLYDQQGNYRGKLSTNPYGPDSTSNPYGRYGSPFSPDSINNPFGAGNPYSPSSPTNPYGHGLQLKDGDPAAEPLHVISWPLDTSVLHREHAAMRQHQSDDLGEHQREGSVLINDLLPPIQGPVRDLAQWLFVRSQ
jgi:hypothetical protein